MKIYDRIMSVGKGLRLLSKDLHLLEGFFGLFLIFLKKDIKTPILLTTYYKWNLHKVRVQDLSKQ